MFKSFAEIEEMLKSRELPYIPIGLESVLSYRVNEFYVYVQEIMDYAYLQSKSTDQSNIPQYINKKDDWCTTILGQNSFWYKTTKDGTFFIHACKFPIDFIKEVLSLNETAFKNCRTHAEYSEIFNEGIKLLRYKLPPK